MIVWLKDKPYNPSEDNKWQRVGTSGLLYPNSVGYVIVIVNITQRAYGGWL